MVAVSPTLPSRGHFLRVASLLWLSICPTSLPFHLRILDTNQRPRTIGQLVAQVDRIETLYG